MADRILVLTDGRVSDIGAAEEIVPRLFGEETEACTCRMQKGGELCEAE